MPIMKRILLLTVLIIPFLLGARSKGYDVYLCIGQSNMAGRGELLPEDSLAVEGVFLLDEAGEMVPATPRANLYSTIRKRASMQGFNLCIPFASKMYKATGRPVLLVVNARGGTGIDQWLKTAPCDTFAKKWGDDPSRYGTPLPQFYSEAVRRARQAMKYGKLKGILWHQGEADASPALRAAYLDKLEILVSDLRKDLKARRAPFVVGEVYAGKNVAINPYLDIVPAFVLRSRCVSSEGTSSKPDDVHFTRSALVMMGERYADEMLSLIQK